MYMVLHSLILDQHLPTFITEARMWKTMFYMLEIIGYNMIKFIYGKLQ